MNVLSQVVAGSLTALMVSGASADVEEATGRKTRATEEVARPFQAVSPVDFSDKAWSTLGRGAIWQVVSPSQVDQLDPDEPWKNNGFFRLFPQGGIVTCSFETQVAVPKGGPGIFFMARDAQAMERGDSYLVYYGETAGNQGRHGQISIAKFINDKPQAAFAPKFAVPAHSGAWASVKFRFDAEQGAFTIWCDGREAGRAQDPQPIRVGSVISLHSFGTAAKFRNLRIESAPRAP